MDTYEQKYKEALKLATKAKNNASLSNGTRRVLEIIFPELAESEDEKIRKELHIYLDWLDGRKDYAPRGEFAIRDMIAWLEKQDDKSQDKTIHEEKTDNDNKVEPKFEIIQDRWYICTHTTCSEDSRIWFKKGTSYLGKEILKYDLGFEPNDYQDYFRLWNIQDAKDGDVLVVPPVKGSEHSEQIFIFKEIKDREYVKNVVEYYCRCMDNEFASNERGFMGQSDDYFTPATKEQRDTLFTKMKNAGYEFNFEKKELKKMEQKPKWSEEDAFRVKTLIEIVISGGSIRFELRNEYVGWLKSLKQRMEE